jgi:hypothetical protein
MQNEIRLFEHGRSKIELERSVIDPIPSNLTSNLISVSTFLPNLFLWASHVFVTKSLKRKYPKQHIFTQMIQF